MLICSVKLQKGNRNSFIIQTKNMEEAKRTLFFNAPGFRKQEIEVAPEIEPNQSKRKPLIDQEVRKK